VKWSEARIMAAAHVENKGKSVLNFDQEFSVALIEFCRARKWRWRHSTGRVVLVEGTSEYDLTAGGGINAPDLEEIQSVYVVEGDGDLRKLDEVTAESDIARAMESTEQDEPTGYFRKPGADMTLVITPVPDAGSIPIRVLHWRVPLFLNAAPGDDNIPIVPGYLHPTLVKQLEVRLLHYSVGVADERYTSAAEELKEMTATAVGNETGG
jgi:hypothetical protein